ncbi:MAG: OmpA family protein [Sediminibacterium sp.]|nr:OmpA family protein [Sediminibacterium sp.]
MGNHHDEHHVTEKKPVAFTVPLILSAVTVLVIVLLVSLCDPKHGHGHESKCECKENCSKECMEACERGEHDKYMTEHATAEEHGDVKPDSVAAPAPVRESLMVKLVNGKELEAYKGGIEDNLVAYLNDAASKLDKEKWFNFDNLLFETGSSKLTPESNRQLQNVADILAAYPKVKLKFGGYTDNVGDSIANVKLSQSRAESVVAELKKLKVNAAQIVGAEGYGPMHPVADNTTEEGRALNRRISVNVREK